MDAKLEANPDAKPLKSAVSDVRDCLLAELFLEWKTTTPAPEKQMDVTFVRSDLKDLTVEHMQALCDFSRDKMIPLLDTCFSRADYLAIATKSAFTTYFENCRNKYGWGKNVICPYKITSVGTILFGNSRPDTCSCKKGSPHCCHVVWEGLKLRHKIESMKK